MEINNTTDIITGELPQNMIDNEQTRLKANKIELNEQIKTNLEQLGDSTETLNKIAKEVENNTTNILNDMPTTSFPKPPFPIEPILNILDTVFKTRTDNAKPRLTGVFCGSKIDIELDNKHVINLAITLLQEKLKEIDSN